MKDVIAGVVCAAMLVAAAGVPAAVAESLPTETPVQELPDDMRRMIVTDLQKHLRDKGYAPGPIDGIYGPLTRGAIERYQRDAGLDVTGIASKELLDHIRLTDRGARTRAR